VLDELSHGFSPTPHLSLMLVEGGWITILVLDENTRTIQLLDIDIRMIMGVHLALQANNMDSNVHLIIFLREGTGYRLNAQNRTATKLFLHFNQEMEANNALQNIKSCSNLIARTSSSGILDISDTSQSPQHGTVTVDEEVFVNGESCRLAPLGSTHACDCGKTTSSIGHIGQDLSHEHGNVSAMWISEGMHLPIYFTV
jgi:hypothetical protein